MMEHVPVFVKVHTTADIDQLINYIRDKVVETHKTLDRISSLSHQEIQKMSAWKSNLQAINERTSTLNELLLEPEG